MSEVSLRELVEAWNEAHREVHAEEARSRAEAARRMDARLEALNALRAEVITDRAQFVTRETFFTKMDAQDQRIELRFAMLDQRIDTLHDQITTWKGRESGMGLIGQIVMGTAGFVAALVAIYLAFG